MIYLIPLFLIFFLVPLKNKKYNLYLLLITLIILGIVRYGIGADYFSYKYMYETLSIRNFYELMAFKIDIEPLFKVAMSLFLIFDVSYEVMLAIFTTLLLVFLTIWITRNSQDPLLSLFLYVSMFYYVWTLSALRQSIPLIGGLFLFFDKRKIELKYKVIGVLILSLFHYSALYLFAVLIFECLDLSYKNLVYLLLASICIGFLPIGKLISYLDFIPLLSKINYYSLSNNVITFGFLVRLFMSLVVLYFHPKLEGNAKLISKNLLLGFITYFVFSFAPIVAGRLNIYTYILIIIYIPQILNLFDARKRKILFSCVVSLSIVYLVKETNTLVDQASLSSKYELPTIFSKENYSFDKYDYYLLEKRYSNEKMYQDFLESLEDKTFVGHNENKMNFVSWNPLIHGYSIYNIDGDFSIDYPMRGRPTIYNDVLTNYYSTDGLFDEIRFIDLLGLGRSEEEIKERISDHNSKIMNSINVNEIRTDLELEDLPKETIDVFDYPSRLSNVIVSKVDDYYILKGVYYYDTIYLYLDNELKPMSEKLFDTLEHYDYLGIIDVKSNNYVYRINSKGDIIWIAK